MISPFKSSRVFLGVLLVCLSLSCDSDIDLMQELSIYENTSEPPVKKDTVNNNSESQSDEESSESETETGSEENTEDNADESTDQTTTEEPNSNESDGTSSSETDSSTTAKEEFLSSLKPVNDAFLQNGTGYNQDVIRLEEGRRTSYLMYDLSGLAHISGKMLEASLLLTVSGDEGDGAIDIYLGSANEWDEYNLNGGTAPSKSVLLGTISKNYRNGESEKIALKADLLVAGKNTLILVHENGNDVAFASKENSSYPGPILDIKYEADAGSEPIDNSDQQTSNNTNGSNGSETSNTNGDSESSDTSSNSTNQPPRAQATANVSTGFSPLTVQFTGENSIDDKGVVSYHWDFKDGSTSNSVNPSHTFTTPGSYRVTLLVKDEQGLTDTAEVPITVNADEPPKAVASANIVQGPAPLTVSFNANASSDDRGITSYYWDFGDSDPSSTKNPQRTFSTPGQYDVTLTVKDGSGQIDSDELTITVESSTETTDDNYGTDALIASSLGFNGSDATDILKTAIESDFSTIVIDKQSGPWVVRPIRFFNVNNKRVIFEEGVVIKAKSGAYPGDNDRMIEFVNSDNVTLEGYGATFQMNKSEYNAGEGRHALSLNGCINFTIKGLNLIDSGGDGLYIKGSNRMNYSKDIYVEDITCSNNRRQGLSVISAENLYVRSSVFRNTGGASPETGVDLEPNVSSERLVNINFENCLFENNNSSGFKVASSQLNGSSIPISVRVRNSEFRNNAKSLSNSQYRCEIFLGADTENPVKGEILFENVTVSESDVDVLFSRKTAEAYKAIFTNFRAENILKTENYAAIVLDAAGGATTLGGYEFNNVYLQYNRDQPFISMRGPRGLILKNITGTFTVKEPYDNPPLYDWGVDVNDAVNLNIQYQHID